MSDSYGSTQRDDRHHSRSRSRSPVSPGRAGETLAECEERRLAEAAVPVGPPAGRPRSPARPPWVYTGRRAVVGAGRGPVGRW